MDEAKMHEFTENKIIQFSHVNHIFKKSNVNSSSENEFLN